MNFLLHIIVIISVQQLSLLGYNLVFGRGKILYFGPLGVSLVSAYATFITLPFIGYPLAIAAGLFAGAILSLIYALLALRLPDDAFGVLSLAMYLAVLAVVLNWSTLTRGSLGIPRIPRLPFATSFGAFTTMVVIMAILWTAFIWYVDRGKLGRALAALSEHPWYGLSVGLNKTTVYISAFLLSGVGIALNNILYPQYLYLLHPSDYLFGILIFNVTTVVAGKPGSVLGVTLANICLVLLKEGIRFLPLSASILGPFRLVLFGCILLGAVWYRRDVLFPQQRTI